MNLKPWWSRRFRLPFSIPPYLLPLTKQAPA
jgi:hypothetical protein